MSTLNLDPFFRRNLLNIKQDFNDRWHGSDEDWHGEHAKFFDTFVGLRAAIYLLAVYQLIGCNTVEKIIQRWAPASDGNDTESYIDFVCKRTWMRSDYELRFFDDDRDMKLRKGWSGELYKLLSAMIQYETFAGYKLADWEFENAVALYEHPNMSRPQP